MDDGNPIESVMRTTVTRSTVSPTSNAVLESVWERAFTNRDGDALEEADAPETIYYTVGDDNMKEWTTTEDTAERLYPNAG